MACGPPEGCTYHLHKFWAVLQPAWQHAAQVARAPSPVTQGAAPGMARRSYRCWTLVVRLLLAAAAACQAYRPLEQPGHGGRRALREGHGVSQVSISRSDAQG